MNCQQLAQKIEQLRPESTPQEVARLCLLLTNTVLNLDDFQNRRTLEEAFAGATRRLEFPAVYGEGVPRRVEVKIPAGVDNGSRIRVRTDSTDSDNTVFVWHDIKISPLKFDIDASLSV